MGQSLIHVSKGKVGNMNVPVVEWDATLVMKIIFDIHISYKLHINQEWGVYGQTEDLLYWPSDSWSLIFP